jgi:uncharacterized protein (TIGR02466 family)
MPKYKEFLSRLLQVKSYGDDDFTWGDLCHVKRESYVVEDWLDLLVEPVRLLSKELKITFNASISHPWANLYEKGGFQEIHYHDDCDIAAVIFLNDGPDFGKFYFWDANHTAFTKPWIKMITKMGLSNIYYPEVKAGDIIFFPSHMMHGVSPHKSDTIRKTFSFNIVVNDVE